jgi:hypothetical protein
MDQYDSWGNSSMRTKHMGQGLGILLALGLLAPSPHAVAQDAKPMTLRLEPKPLDGVDMGKAVVVKGTTGKTPQRYLLEGISYMTPVAVALRPVNAGDEVGMAVSKYAWNQPLRQGKTDKDILRYLFRTEGEFQVSVTAGKEGIPYRLLVWVGDETKPDFAPVVVKASAFEGDTSGGSPVLWVIAGALLIGVALLAVLVLRRKQA